ncbi:MAG: site-specific DNA-methyltransferase [Bacteroidales bacterium]|nr:site-specific DNA-methyltransferase [Bacteroidales bacterium]
MERPERLGLQSADGVQLNLDALYQIAPSCFPEAPDPNTGGVKRVVNFDVLRQLLGDDAVEDAPEAYEFNWVGKQAARAEVLRPINKTLRPVKEDSVDWDNTQNLYIEGDNLEVLKLLQKSYLGKVKMIYIDPPYNTGNDFVYHDDFARTQNEENLAAGNVDELGNRYRKNTDSNGRYHSDWCSMIYSRLMIARSLLTEDGVIFISIDDNEQRNLKNIADEVFGESNFRNTILTRRRIKSLNSQFADNGLYSMNVGYEYVLVYAKTTKFLMKALQMTKAEKQSKGRWDVFWSNADRPTMRYDILGFTPQTGQWRNSKEKADIAVQNYKVFEEQFASKMTLEEYYAKTGIKEYIRRIPNGVGKNGGVQHWVAPSDSMLRTSNWTDIEVSQIGKEINLPFDNPKSKLLLMEICRLIRNDKDFLTLDFFSGSATTAHAVMQLNAEDGGNRKFIMVQLPEETPEDSEAYKAGYKNICEIGKERIRRAGKKIKEESPLTTRDLDTGFRVFRVDSSNYEEVEHAPKDWNQDQLDLFLDNIKSDRTNLDLLFGCMLDWGVQLSLPMTTEEVEGKKIYTVNEGDLVACFADKVTDNVVRAMAEKQPLRVIFRDSCFERDADKINIYETFKQLLDWSDQEVVKNIRVI